VAVCCGEATGWAEAGHPLAQAQFELIGPELQPTIGAGEAATPPGLRPDALGCSEDAASVRVKGEGFEIHFDRVRGRLHSWRTQAGPLIVPGGGPRIGFWRAPIDNDQMGGGKHVIEPWRKLLLDRWQHRADSFEWSRSGPGIFEAQAEGWVGPPGRRVGFAMTYHYRLEGSGLLSLTVRGAPRGDLGQSLPRIGLELELPGHLDRALWFGRGPGESYRDSFAAAPVGRYEAKIDDLFTPYVHPQENGNRMNTRWVKLLDQGGDGLQAWGGPLIDFAAMRFTAEDLDSAQHSHELKPKPSVHLRLDHAHRGIGSGSCWGGLPESLWLRPDAFEFSVRLAPLRPKG
jgi:beta-galactosidase/evolved beta-galactosidase subunit alpha